ncbi:DUF5776 domain-containing protein [Lentilactobacillus kisonensis]|uniref:DUF4430 domain-containing protein n=1 Tax=Lentilactobacillus kisonensis F0435 TaxID=797516 RepID=H1LFW9_9LACO|nr:DUF5776 domain-containing protein [Lentilactobacillus kisonensis]EHO51423.1 hypothetical protein HMPREF9104_01495 [Lentilactobacillus kisonensis F0435]
MNKKRLIYWISLILGVFLLFIGGSSVAKADTASDVDAAIATGVNYTAQKSKFGGWDAPIFALSNNGITNTQAQNGYQAILAHNDYISGGHEGYMGITDVAAIISLRALGKDPTNVENKDLVAHVIDDANTNTDLNGQINDLEGLSSGNYGAASETARTNLVNKILKAQESSGMWNDYGRVYTTGSALTALSMNLNQPDLRDTITAAIKKAVGAITSTYYQEDGGFADKADTEYGSEDASNSATLVAGLAATANITNVNVYSSLNGQDSYASPVQNLLKNNVTSTPANAFLLYEGTSALQQAQFTNNGGIGSIFAFDQNAAFKPGELASFTNAATAKKQAISNDSQATTADQNNAISTVNQILATYTAKINADTTSAEAIADRNAGVAEINNVTVPHVAPIVQNNGLSVSTTAPSSTTTAAPISSPISTPVVTSAATNKKPSVNGSVVYGLTTIKLYKNTNFTKSNLTKTYKKQARVNRPMFLVISQTTNKQGKAVYKVKDTKSGKTGYTLSGSKYFNNAYYSANVTKIKVINPKGINEYNKVKLTNKQRHVKKNTSLTVKKVVNYGRTTRFLLTNDNYVSANKKLVFATKYDKASDNTTTTTPSTVAPTTITTPTTTNSTSSSTSSNSSTGTVSNNNTPVTPTPVVPTATETVTVNATANGNVLSSGSVTIPVGSTALDALYALARQNGLNVTVSGSGSSAYVTGINGYSAGKSGTDTGWLCYVSGNFIQVSLGAYVLKNGDTVSMEYNK